MRSVVDQKKSTTTTSAYIDIKCNYKTRFGTFPTKRGVTLPFNFLQPLIALLKECLELALTKFFKAHNQQGCFSLGTFVEAEPIYFFRDSEKWTRGHILEVAACLDALEERISLSKFEGVNDYY